MFLITAAWSICRRLQRRYRKGDTAKAAAAYPYDLQLAEALLPSLNVLEIALRNSIHHRLTETYGSEEWWATRNWTDDGNFTFQNARIAEAKAALSSRHEPQNPDKIVAELSFGFWTSLFNAQFQDNLWGPLRRAFPRCPKKIRKRDTISSALAQVRSLRNRGFHHEPLLWLGPSLEDQHQKGLEVIEWLNPKLRVWLEPLDRFPQTWTLWKEAQKVGGL
ncbi:Abi family protein [Caballeronia ptereochthonis]|uniref:Abi family protein n=1 Tax=Caballeronia ptereochthonis TaxID=1777144 RepID=UPI000AB04F42|nr:Abi family protein [Caballeronia ptereochthonis]